MSETSKHESIGLVQIFVLFLGLGCYCFGGPIAHISYFKIKFVEERKWLDEDSFLDLIALCQSLPGPSSSQTCFSLGVLQKGWLGGIASWSGFILPSATIMIGFALGISYFEITDNVFLHGIVVAAVAVILNAIVSLSQKILVTRKLFFIACLGAITSILVPVIFPNFSNLTTIIVIIISAFFGNRLELNDSPPGRVHCETVPKNVARIALVIFGICIILPMLILEFFGETYQGYGGLLSSGALVFGGGHVVLPLLQQTLVDTGILSSEEFLTGYGLSNAVPGPMFSLGGYLGAIMSPVNKQIGIVIFGILGIIALNLPGLAIVLGLLPNWESFRRNKNIRNILSGINAGVVGLLFSTFILTINFGILVWNRESFDSLFVVHTIIDCFMVGIGFVLLYKKKAKSWYVVLMSAVILGLVNTTVF
ncbi:MAG: chromate efflux transporter [Candidatus Thermoplasmatota archaeon]|nr:chromate efflux transporter [Candidatus Thermoplasmatota archaeon]